jgi:DNA-binding transcriptional LysR family regulator
MELRHLRYFATAAVEGSLHRASARLRIAQPALSRQIRDLEKELDVALFARSAGGVKLTQAGEVLLADVKRLLPQIDQARARAQRAGTEQLGMLRIGATLPAAEARFAVGAFAEIRRLLPSVDFQLNVIDSGRIPDAFSKDDIDLGLLYRRTAPPAGMVCRDLRTEHFQLVVPIGHPLTRRPKITLADLSEEDMLFVSPTLRPAAYDEILSACMRGGLTPRIVYQVDNESIMLNMISEGIGICFAISSLRDRRVTDGVKFLDVEDFDVKATLCAMWPQDRETPILQKFVDLLVQYSAREDASPRCKPAAKFNGSAVQRRELLETP